jgi:hypothetical protein
MVVFFCYSPGCLLGCASSLFAIFLVLFIVHFGPLNCALQWKGTNPTIEIGEGANGNCPQNPSQMGVKGKGTIEIPHIADKTPLKWGMG